MNILDNIVAKKKIEVAKRKQNISIQELEKQKFFTHKTVSLKEFLLDKNRTGIIAEYKRKSPSKGIINNHSTVEEVTTVYAKYASGISVLTDEEFFGGNMQDLINARINAVPLLRKDFMIDEYQIIEAKANGADVILLIAACLSKAQTKNFSALAKNIGLEVLLEIHNEEELNYIDCNVDLVGVNNRNLKTFEVNIQTSLQLIHQIPANKLAIAESGINNVDTIVTLRNAGFKGFLIGENFMKENNPPTAFINFVQQLKTKLV
ncbi:MAG: indole-3-glycerol phosphate synthase TrpC [Bacteroidetes bacterium]|nr:indole-3-glycerol phosphate synthase TrpC [Bacteroidota bacterium]MBS1649739.1 indole-3-glycerol phosphate synthase TrpC [Bacteroidota bacterium]